MSERWPAEKEARLRQLVDDGLTASRIAVELGLPSRDAALGKIFRLGLRLAGKHGGQSVIDHYEEGLRRAWAEGLSGPEIARRLRLSSHKTVSAWARRLELPERSRHKGGRPRKIAAVKPASAPKPKVEQVMQWPVFRPKARAAGPMPFLEATEGRCRFPLWSDAKSTPVEFLFYCGDPSGQSSYCPHHASRCYGIGSRAERNAHKVAA